MTLHLTFHSLESVRKLLEKILNDTLIVVAPAQNVVQRRKAMCLAGFFLMIELFGVELVIADHAPVITGSVHRKTWRQRTKPLR